MEKRKWLWKRKPSDISPGQTESSESTSSHSERYSDDQDGLKALPNDNTQSPEATSKVTACRDEMDYNVKILTEKLSAALVNVGAKEDLVKQHAKVAEEAVAGWEKAEKEVTLLKQQLDALIESNTALEARRNHLDEALKECVRQLRQGREEQKHKILEVVSEKSREWESKKNDLETQLKFLERENEAFKQELLSRSKEMEIMTIERDLSTQAAENASKQHLEGIKKIAKLEAECRKLQMLNRKSPLSHDQKSVSASSIYVESLSDSQLDSEIDQIKNSDKSFRTSITGSLLEIDIMDDFLEMERLVTQPGSETKVKKHCSNVNNEDYQLKADSDVMNHRVVELEEKLKIVGAEKKEPENVLADFESSYKENQLKDDIEEMSRGAYEFEETVKALEAEKKELENVLVAIQSSNEENQLKADFENTSHRVVELEEKLEMIEADKIELKTALAASQSAYEESKFQLKSAEMKVKTLQKRLDKVNESSKVELLKEEIEEEKNFSKEIAVKCRELEKELENKFQEIELQQAAISNGIVKVEQEELEVAAGKLAECQKTISSLGRQLKSLATLKDFLIDTANLPGFSGDSEFWKLNSNYTFISENTSDQTKIPFETLSLY